MVGKQEQDNAVETLLMVSRLLPSPDYTQFFLEKQHLFFAENEKIPPPKSTTPLAAFVSAKPMD